MSSYQIISFVLTTLLPCIAVLYLVAETALRLYWLSIDQKERKEAARKRIQALRTNRYVVRVDPELPIKWKIPGTQTYVPAISGFYYGGGSIAVVENSSMLHASLRIGIMDKKGEGSFELPYLHPKARFILLEDDPDHDGLSDICYILPSWAEFYDKKGRYLAFWNEKYV